MEKRIYKNSQLTKTKIKNAFLILLSQKSISKIRIHEITEIVGITKGAFYTHYQDIYAVFEDIENENIKNIKEFLSCNQTQSLIDDFTPFIEKLISQIIKEKDTYIILLKSDLSSRFTDKLQGVFVEHMMQNTELTAKLESLEIAENFFQFVAAGTASLIYSHLLSTKNQELDILCKTLNRGILHGISAFKKEI